MKMNFKTLFLCRASVIAALYFLLTYISAISGLASGVVQLRLSEALCILPMYTAAAVPGLIVGCLISNILFGMSVLDIIFGTLATAIGAVGSYLLRRYKFSVPLPPIAANTIIIPFVLFYSGMTEEGIPYMMLTVGIGELLSCGVLGIMLMYAVKPYSDKLFR